METIWDLIGIITGILIMSLFFWGIGNLIILAFNIGYTWTLLHGFVSFIIFHLLKCIFGKM